jgi:hypothetical protein
VYTPIFLNQMDIKYKLIITFLVERILYFIMSYRKTSDPRIERDGTRYRVRWRDRLGKRISKTFNTSEEAEEYRQSLLGQEPPASKNSDGSFAKSLPFSPHLARIREIASDGARSSEDRWSTILELCIPAVIDEVENSLLYPSQAARIIAQLASAASRHLQFDRLRCEFLELRNLVREKMGETSDKLGGGIG